MGVCVYEIQISIIKKDIKEKEKAWEKVTKTQRERRDLKCGHTEPGKRTERNRITDLEMMSMTCGWTAVGSPEPRGQAC